MPRQPRRCAGRQAGAHRRGEDEPRSEVNGFPPHWKRESACGFSREVRKFYFKSTRVNGPVFRELCEASLNKS
jgi:hypothetical protein